MSTKSKLLALLNDHLNTYVSGQKIANSLGLSRNAIWKAVNKLREEGYKIDAVTRKGYRLREFTDIVSETFLKEKIEFPCQVRVFDKVDSTNNIAKEIRDCRIPQILVAEEQIGGRGRMGKEFFSPPGKGLYMTIAFQPDFELDKAMLMTATIAVSVSNGISKITGLSPKIKWVNDIYLKEKKVAGILTEAESSFETGEINKIIIGIGINCFKSDFPEELSQVAGYLKDPPKPFTRNDLAAAIVNEFFARLKDFNRILLIREYKAKSFILGEQILIFNQAVAKSIGRPEERWSEGIKARAIDIDENGGLVVEYLEGRKMRTMETLTSGEITIRKSY